MNLIDTELLIVLHAYGSGWISVDDLRAFLAERYFPLPPSLNPFERMVIGELELGLAEIDRGDRSERDIRELASLFASVFGKLQKSLLTPSAV